MIQIILSIVCIYVSFTSISANRLLSSESNDKFDGVNSHFASIKSRRSLLDVSISTDNPCAPTIVSTPGTITADTMVANPGYFPSCGTSNDNAGAVWFKIDGQIRDLTVSTCENNSPPGGANYDTKISVFKPDECGCFNCGDQSSFICVDGNDDQSSCSFHSTKIVSGTYCNLMVVLHGFYGAEGTADVHFDYTQLGGECPDCGKGNITTKGECEQCLSWSSYLDLTDCRGTQIQPVDFEDIASRIDDCADGFSCLLDDTPGVTLAASGINRRLIYVYPEATVRTGICIPTDGISATVPTCTTDDECPSCMRCCGDESDNGIKQCVRLSGDVCGLEFSGRGPCCCDPEYTCCNDECVTQSPTPAPTELPTPAPTTVAPTNDDSNDAVQEIFGAEQMSGSNDLKNNENENVNMKWITDMGNQILITLWSMITVLGIGVISMIVLGCLCLYKKKGQASFIKNDHIDEDV